MEGGWLLVLVAVLMVAVAVMMAVVAVFLSSSNGVDLEITGMFSNTMALALDS